jgi:hypothetical protein
MQRRASAHCKGGGPFSAPQHVVACEGSDEGRRTTIFEAGSFHSLHRGCGTPMDEISPAIVDERALGSVAATARSP